jgi:toxin ParE1/3/4
VTARVVIRDAARRDLVDYYEYFVEFSDRATADRFRSAIDSVLQQLAAMPHLGVARQFRNAELAGTRMWPVRGFREFIIFYRPIVDGIEVLRLLHAKRDYRRILDV